MRLFKKHTQNPKLLASLKKVTFRSKYYKYDLALLFSLLTLAVITNIV